MLVRFSVEASDDDRRIAPLTIEHDECGEQRLWLGRVDRLASGDPTLRRYASP